MNAIYVLSQEIKGTPHFLYIKKEFEPYIDRIYFFWLRSFRRASLGLHSHMVTQLFAIISERNSNFLNKERLS